MSFASTTQRTPVYPSIDKSVPEYEHADVATHHEIDFESVSHDDVRLLQASAQAIYEEALNYEAIVRADQYVRISLAGVQPEECFTSLDSALSRLQVVTRAYLAEGAPMTEDRYTEMVDLYEHIRDFRDHVVQQYGAAATGEAEPHPSRAEGQISSFESSVAPAGDSALAQAESHEIERSVGVRVIGATGAAIATHEEKVDGAAAERLRAQVFAFVAEVTEANERLQALFPRDQRSPTVSAFLRELAVSQKRAEQLKTNLHQSSSDRDSVERMQDEIRSNVAAIEAGLQYVQREQVVAVSAQPAPSSESGESQMSVVVSLPDTVTESLASLTAVPAAVPVDSGSAPQTDVGARILSVKEPVAHNKGVSCEFSVGERYEHQTLATQSDPVMVAGMAIPQSGPDGIPGVRAFREGLMVARESHQAFRQYPRKRLLVDKMVRLLAQVPKDGISDTEVTALTRLAREIDVPALDVSAQPLATEVSSMPSAEPTSAPKTTVRTESPPAVLTGRKSRTLAIESSDAPHHQTIPLTVKTKAPAPDSSNKVRSHSAGVYHTSAAEVVSELNRSSNAQSIGADTTAVLGVVESRDPVNVAVPATRPTVRSWQERKEASALVPLAELRRDYPEFFAHVESAEFDRILRAEVAAHERAYTNRLDEWLGVTRTTAFSYIQNLSLRELKELESATSAAERDRFLEQTNVVYDSFISWCDRVPAMRQFVESTDDMTFGELLARAIIEEEMR